MKKELDWFHYTLQFQILTRLHAQELLPFSSYELYGTGSVRSYLAFVKLTSFADILIDLKLAGVAFRAATN